MTRPTSLREQAGPLVTTARPKQWVKNVLVFAAPLAAARLDEPAVFGRSLVALVSLCLAASGTYLVNDLADIEADRAHPGKRGRPLPSGRLRPEVARVGAAVLLTTSLAIAAVAGVDLLAVVAVYIALTSSYSLFLKHVAFVDLAAIAAGFVLRAVAGGAATGIGLSVWFLAVSSAGSVLVVVGKREAELRTGPGPTARPALASYRREALLGIGAGSAAAAIVAYAVWVPAGDVIAVGPALLTALPFAAAVGRYAWLIVAGRAGDPEDVLRNDRPFQLAVAAWFLAYLGALYV